MNKHTETLEDLLCYLGCARDSLLVIHNIIEADNLDKAIILNALYGAYNHMDFIARSMMKHVEKIPLEILEKAGREVSE